MMQIDPKYLAPTGTDPYDWEEELLDQEDRHEELEDEDIPDENYAENYPES